MGVWTPDKRRIGFGAGWVKGMGVRVRMSSIFFFGPSPCRYRVAPSLGRALRRSS